MKISYLLSLRWPPRSLFLRWRRTSPKQHQTSRKIKPRRNQRKTADQSTATGKEALKYERHEGFWGHLNPFAARAM